MTREEKLEAIYEEIANKELTFGCKAKHTTKRWLIYDVILVWQMIYWEKYFVRSDSLWYDVEWVYENDWVITFVWHPVMIGDVLDYIEPYWKGYAQDVRFDRERKRKIDIALLQWDKKREPIEAQSDGCIDFIYSLIQK